MLEGDNLLLRPVSFLAEAYQIKELEIDATITHISFHASFLSLDFVTQLNVQASTFASFTGKSVNACFLTGPGQEMRLGYEAARFLQIARYARARAEGTTRVRNARILNTAGGTVPCVQKERRWVSLLEKWCQGDGARFPGGPCDLNSKLSVFNDQNLEMFEEKTLFQALPMLLECEPSAPPPVNASLTVPGSIQESLETGSVRQSTGDCTADSPTCRDPIATDEVRVSKTFYCETSFAGEAEDKYKALSFKDGRAFSMLPKVQGDTRFHHPPRNCSHSSRSQVA